MSTTDWVCRLDPDAIFDKHQVAYDLSYEYYICLTNDIILGTRLASITSWIGGSLSDESSFLIPIIP